MSTIIEREKLDTDPIELLKTEVERSKKERHPISRYGLAEIVAERTQMPLEQAQLLVEAFCDENATAVPAYLGSELKLFWPKVWACILAAAGFGIFWFGRDAWLHKKPAWMWFALGTIVFGLGVFQWVRSLESYRARRRVQSAERERRLREKYAKPR